MKEYGSDFKIIIRMNLKKIGINMRNWVESAKDRDYWRALVNARLNLRVPQAMELVNNIGLQTNGLWRT